MRFILASLLFGGAAAVSGQSIAGYDIQGNVASGDGLTASVVDPVLSVSPFTIGAGLTGNSTFGFEANQFVGSGGVNQPDLASAIADNDYFSFTVTPNAGATFSASQFDGDILFNHPDNAGEGSTFSAFFLSDATGFDENSSLGGLMELAVGSAEIYDFTIDLSSVGALQNVATPVEFRVYVAQSVSATFQAVGFVGDDTSAPDITLSGTAVPEPAAAGLLAAGAIALGLIRRR
ncbi:MAG: PEP-CTERM sorting domain-containing protein [Opitutales bacterium]